LSVVFVVYDAHGYSSGINYSIGHVNFPFSPVSHSVWAIPAILWVHLSLTNLLLKKLDHLLGCGIIHCYKRNSVV